MYLVKRRLGGGVWLYIVYFGRERIVSSSNQKHATRFAKKLVRSEAALLQEWHGGEVKVVRLTYNWGRRPVRAVVP